MPPPPGHREIQQEELSRLFGRMAGARLVALPPILGLAVWLAFVEPARWRRGLLVVAVTALVAFFVADDSVHGTELWKTDGTPAGTAVASGAALAVR